MMMSTNACPPPFLKTRRDVIQDVDEERARFRLNVQHDKDACSNGGEARVPFVPGL